MICRPAWTLSQELVAFLGELHAKGVDLFLHQQGLDTSTPAGKAIQKAYNPDAATMEKLMSDLEEENSGTSVELKKEAEEGRFRQDFYCRLNVFPIEVPPLRERKEDIPVLAGHFLKQAARRLRLPMPRFTDAHARLLQSYDWPGNVRELQNATERALILAQKGVLQFDLVQAELNAPPPPPPPNPIGGGMPILTELEWRQRERGNMHAALFKSGWRIHGAGGAAELLGLKPTTLISRMKKMGLKRPEPEPPPHNR